MSLAPVPFLQLFRYSSREDLILLGIANLFIIYSSLNIPLVNIVYGLMMREMNDFVARKAQLLTNQLGSATSSSLTVASTTSASIFLSNSSTTISQQQQQALAGPSFNGTLEDSRSLFMDNSFSLCMIVIIFGATRFITLYLALLFFSRAAANQAKRVKMLFFRSLLRQEVSWFDQNRTGDFAIRITSDLSKFEEGIGEKIALCLNALFAWISSLVSSFYYGWELTLVCLVLVPLTVFITTVIAEFQANYSVRESAALSQAFNVCHEVISSIRTVFAFSGEHKERQRFKRSLDKAYRCGLQRNMFGALNLGFTWMSGYLGFAICLLYSTKFYSAQHYGHYDEAHIITILWSAAGCVFLLNRMMPFIEIIQIARGSASNLFSVIERQSQMDVSSSHGLRPQFFQSNVRFENVSFAYPNQPTSSCGADSSNSSSADASSTTAAGSPSLTGNATGNHHHHHQTSNEGSMAFSGDSGLNNSGQDFRSQAPPTIRGLSLEVKSGQTIALVGPSGSGKSTVLALLQRFYDIHAGSITLDGHELRDLNLAWLRSQFGVVTQEPVLFDMSIADNIRLGARPGQQLSDQDIEQVAKAANAHSFIVRLPEGYETRAGARGIQLSGGQKQRIAIARALVRQPKILLLDEATSALDLESESIVQKALDRASVGRTTFVVAHRLSTIRNADKIFVFERGTIVETGTHEELLQLRGLYHQISTQQRQGVDLYPGAASGSRRASQVTQPHLTSMDHSHHLVPYNRESRSLSIYSTGKYAATAGALGGGAMGHGGNGEAADNGGSCTCSPPGGERSRFTNYLYSLRNDERDEEEDDDEDDDEEEEEDIEKLAGQQVCPRISVQDEPLVPEVSSSLIDALPAPPLASKSVLGFNEETQCSLLEGLSFAGGAGGPSKSKGGKRVRSLSIRAILQFIKPNPAFSIVGMLSSLLMGLCIPISALIIGDIATIFSTDQREHIQLGLYTHGLLYTVLAAFAFVVSLIQVMSFGLAGEKIGLRLRMRGFAAILSRDISWFDLKRNNPGAICARLASDVGNVQLITGNRTAVIFQSISILISTFIFAIYFNPKFSSICALFVAILLISTLMQARYAGKLAMANRNFDSQMGKIVLESSANIKTLVSLHQEEHFIGKCEQLLAKDQRSMSLDNHLRLSLESLKYAMTAISKGSAFYFAARMLANDEIAIDVIFKLIEIILYGLTEASKSLIFISDLQKARRGTQNLYKLIMHQHQQSQLADYPTEQQQVCVGKKMPSDRKSGLGLWRLLLAPFRALSGCCQNSSYNNNNYKQLTGGEGELEQKEKEKTSCHAATNLPAAGLLLGQGAKKAANIAPVAVGQQQARGELQFRNLRFHYPGRLEVCVLKSLSLEIKSGKSVALVGRSGCGKSTVVQLLERFYDYLQGEILLDGVELRRLPVDWVRRQLALVGQEPALLSYSIGDNIRYGDNSRQVPFEEVVRAAQVANIHEFIMSLPEQYDTLMSESNSMQLSGGQKQRIAIARALVRQAPILILDEATSALDTKSEQVVQEALERAQEGRTTLVIAHRLTSIKKADAIVVLKDGLVVEQGTHEELMERRGEYYSLYRTQSRF